MIIIDLQGICIANLSVLIGVKQEEFSEASLRIAVLNSIRSIKQKFGHKYGEIVIACDAGNVWRKKVFPYYKASRKKARDSSTIDWASFFDAMNNIRAELKEFFPYRLIHIDGCEADDVIGTLVHDNGAQLGEGNGNIMIISADHDFQQLQVYSNVFQFDYARKKAVRNNQPEEYLLTHILKGDAGDGIPNVLSADNCFVMSIRQTPLTQKKIDIIDTIIDENEEVRRNFNRNKILIDLKNTPENLKMQIRNVYEEQANEPKKNLFNFFIEKRLTNLIDVISEF